jgi:hypothetical protein
MSQSCFDIVLWYDSDIGNCSLTSYAYSERLLKEKLDLNEINYCLKKTTDAVDYDDLNVYVIELKEVEQDVNVFKEIPEVTKQMIRDGVSLLLNFGKEGFDAGDWLLRIYNYLKKENLLPADVYLVFSDLDFQYNYQRFLTDNGIDDFFTRIINFDYFKGEYYDTLVDISTDVSEYKKISVDSKDKNFLFYNGKVRISRVYAVSELDRMELLDHSLVSFVFDTYMQSANSIDGCINTLADLGIDTAYARNFFKNRTPMILDKYPSDFSFQNQNQVVQSHYDRTFFSIVSEMSMTTRFVTEKTYKPIFNQHPFILIAAPGMLSYLKGQGYETFPELFDESYDSIEDHFERVKAVLEQIRNFCNLSSNEKIKRFESVKNKLIHNRKNYILQAQTTKANDILSIFEVINESRTRRRPVLDGRYTQLARQVQNS